MEMTKYKLGDIAEIQTGPFGSQLHNEDYVTEGTPIVTVEHLGNKYFTTQNLPLVSDEDKKRLNRYCLKENDIVFSRVGSVDRCSFVSKNEEGWLFSGRCLRVRPNPKIIEPQWLYYFFTQSHFKEYVRNKAVGCTMPSLNTELLSELGISFPSLKDQKKIASVLSALDDKIALNKKMNQKLEAMAKRLYDYWFVQFDFPDKNGRPYKTTGGPMTYNPTLKREIPAGWEVSNICPLMEILPGGTPSKAKPEYWNGEIPFFGPTDYCGDVFELSTEEHITENGLNNCASALYPPKTIFITARGSVGKLIVCGKPMAMNQSCYALKPFDLEKYEYLFYLTKQLIEQLKKKGSGSVFKSINTLDIEQSFMSIAPNEIIELYCKKVKSIFERIKSNTVEIAKLTALRDKLLPLLMNGQVIVRRNMQ